MATIGPTKARHIERLAGNLLRLARARVGMSQRQLAAAAGLSQSTVAWIESGARQPSLPLLARILAAVDLELRIRLEAYDSHDDVLDATDAQLNDTQRAARRVAQEAFIEKLRLNNVRDSQTEFDTQRVARRDLESRRRISLCSCIEP